jgi:hypothetical protein
MLRKLSDEIADCHAHAQTCAQKAAEAPTDQDREDYLRLQQHWLTLARSYELGERLDDFSKENARRRHEYRLFIYNQDGQIAGTPFAISAAGDEEALAKAEAVRGSLAAELLNVHSMRIVRRFPRNGK